MSTATTELNRKATRAGVTKETFGQYMNIARRFQGLNLLDRAATSAQHALRVHADWPHLFGDVKPDTLNVARRMADGERP